MPTHFMKFGHTACMMEGPPVEWPEGHKWTSVWKHVTCDDCLLGRHMIHTFKISADRKSITCRGCGHKSTDPKDVENHTCPACHVSHDDLWPPARRAWIKQGKAVLLLEAQIKVGRSWTTVSTIKLADNKTSQGLVTAWFSALLKKYRPTKPEMRVAAKYL